MRQKRSLEFQLSGMSLCFPPSPTSCWFGELTGAPPPAHGDPRKHRRKAGGWVALTSRTPALSSPGLPCSGLGHLPPEWGARGHGARPSQSGAQATLLGPAVLLHSTAATGLAVSVPSGVTRQQAEVTLSSSTAPPPLKLHRLARLLALGQDNRLLRKTSLTAALGNYKVTRTGEQTHMKNQKFSAVNICPLKSVLRAYIKMVGCF